MSTRSHKELRNYRKHRRSFKDETSCVFCEIDSSSTELITETAHFKVITNKFPYSLWDDQTVLDHLMIVPRQHTNTLSDLLPDEAQEYIQLVSSYEKNGYNVWARAPQSSMKSVIHQHTHLIKPGKKTLKIMLYIRKPYFRLHH